MFENIIGTIDDPDLAERLHQLRHMGKIESIILSRQDVARHRLRAVSDAGNEFLIALPRNQRLSNGAVLLINDDRAVIVRLQEERWLTLEPLDVSAALELGYQAGNMHWRVRFAGNHLKVAVESEEETYLVRLRPLIETGRIRQVDQ